MDPNIECKLTYNFDPTTGLGNLVGEEESPIFVKVVDPGFCPALDISHPNLLNVVAFDRANNRVLYSRHDSSFETWITTQSQTEKVVEVYEIPGTPISKYHPKQVVKYIPESYKKMFHAMVSVIEFLHSKNLCIKSLGMENLVVLDGVLRFWLVSFVKLNDVTAKKDYTNLYCLLVTLTGNDTKMSPEKMGNLPADMKNFFQQLLRLTRSPGSNFLVDHIALLSSTEKIFIFRDWKEKYPSLDTKDADDFWIAVNRSNNEGGGYDHWNVRLTSFPVLERSFKQTPKTKTMSDGQTKKIDGYIVRRTSTSHVELNFSQLRFIRNVISHARDLQAKFNQGKSDIKFKDKDIDLMIFDYFQKFILELQENLFRANMLKTFRIT